MADHTINALSAAARALDEVIFDAVDAGHPLAREQTRLVSKYLKLLQSRLEYAYDRNRFELSHYTDLAGDLLADAGTLSPAIAAALGLAAEEGRRLRDLPGARAPDLQAAAQRLAAIITALIRTAADADPVLRGRVEAAVLLSSKSLLDAQRAWFLPQGWEPDPTVVPPIAGAFALAKRPADPARARRLMPPRR